MQKRVKIQTITDLTNDLTSLYEQCRSGQVEADEAKLIANVASKVMKSAALKLDYNKHLGIKTQIAFLK